MTNVYINITPTAKYGGNTGIQRVVRELSNILDNQERNRVNFIFIVFIKRHYWVTYSDFLLSQNQNRNNSNVSIFHRIKSYIKVSLPNSITSRCSPIWMKLNRYAANAKAIFRYKSLNNCFPHNSILVNLDAGWIDDWQYISDISIPKIQVVYDIIPITHPQFCLSQHNENFATWIDTALKTSIATISISKAAMADIVFYSDKLKLNNLVYKYFYLGSDITQETDSIENSSHVLCTKHNYFIVVGSIEPRKNHLTLIEAFHRYKKQGGDWDLIIVGRNGWQSSEIISAITESTYYNSSIFWLNNTSDNELVFLYSNASAAIIPSFVEGFGLPLIEASHYGKPVIASNIPVFREVGDESVTFFDVNSPGNLAECMKNVSSTSPSDKISSTNNCNYLSWQESANMFANAITEIIEVKGIKND